MPLTPILPGVYKVSFPFLLSTVTEAVSNCGNTVAPSSVSVSNVTRLHIVYITKEQLFTLLNEI